MGRCREVPIRDVSPDNLHFHYICEKAVKGSAECHQVGLFHTLPVLCAPEVAYLGGGHNQKKCPKE